MQHMGATFGLIQQRGLEPETILPNFLACYRQVLSKHLAEPQLFLLLRFLDLEDVIIRTIRDSEVRMMDVLSELRHTIEQRSISMSSQDTAPAPQGPPFDEALLLLPERFVGRDADLRWLLSRLPKTTGISVLRGMAGIGKTALAARVVRQLRIEGFFQDGIAVVLCDELTDATDVIQHILARFDAQRRLPTMTGLAELTDITRRLLEGKDVLIVLDALEPELAIEPVVRALLIAKISVLLIARHTLPSSIGVPHTLGLLSLEDALELFAHAFGHDSASNFSQPDRIAAERIVKALGRHTLTVRLAGAYAASLQRDLGALASELEDDPRRALRLPDGEHYISLIFDKSLGTLPPDIQKLFIALAAFGTADFGRRAALAFAEKLGLAKAEEGVNLLVQRALLDPSLNNMLPEGSDRERLWQHPLLRIFAAEVFASRPEKERDAAHRAIARYYAVYTNSVEERALAADENNITDALEWAHNHNEDDLVVLLCTGMQHFWRNRGRTADALRYLPWGKAVAEAAVRRERLREISLTITYAQVLRNTGKLDSAEEAFKAALAILHEVGNQGGEGEVLGYLGEIACRRGRPYEAEHYLQQSLPMLRAVQNWRGESKALTYLGYAAENRGNLKQAEELFREALAIVRREPDLWHESEILAALGHIDRRLGKLERAKWYYEQSLAICREVQNRQDEGINLAFLGEIDRRLGKLEDANRELREGLRICREVQDRRGEGWVLSYLGKLAQDRGELDVAEGYFRDALAIAHEVQDRWREGEMLAFLGDVARQREHLEEAEQDYQQSLSICREVQDRRGEGLALFGLGKLAQSRNQFDEAESYYAQAISTLRNAQDASASAKVAYDFGVYLIEQQDKHEEGCALLEQALRLYAEMGLPREQEVRETAQRLKCNV